MFGRPLPPIKLRRQDFLVDLRKVLRWRRKHVACATCAFANWMRDKPEANPFYGGREIYSLRGSVRCQWSPPGWPAWAWQHLLRVKDVTFMREGPSYPVLGPDMSPDLPLKDGRYVCDAHQPIGPSTARVSARDEPRIDPDRELPSEVRKEP